MKQKQIDRTRVMLTEYRNTLQDMAFAIEDGIDYSELPAHSASVLADKLYACQRDMEQLHRDFELALKQGDL